MSGWIILADRRDGEAIGGTNGSGEARTLATPRDYINRPTAFAGAGSRHEAPKIVNLARSYAPLGLGHYCSLLAEARGHRVIPTVETILELRQKSLYAHALPDLEEDLNRRFKRLTAPPEGPFKLLICFGLADDGRFQAFGRRVFDWFRAPALEVRVRPGPWLQIASIKLISFDSLEEEWERQHFLAALDRYTRRAWRAPKTRTTPRYTLAVLHNPKEELPPSSPRALQRLARVAETMGVKVELIEKRDLLRLPEYDALLIRETTSIEDHTYRFALRAAQEGMPVIDDPTSILRCTNKVYLAELLQAHGIATPRTELVDSLRGVERLEDSLGYPLVLKIPDGSFSRGVFKARDRRELKQMAEGLLEDSDVILAQEFIATDFDWRVGVLDGEPLFVCQYLMAKKHWQIVKHNPGGTAVAGGFKTFAVADAPAEVVDTAVRAARLIGSGLYGVDLKQVTGGPQAGRVVVIEINDNPNLDAGVEDAILKDDLWRKLIDWYLRRLR